MSELREKLKLNCHVHGAGVIEAMWFGCAFAKPEGYDGGDVPSALKSDIPSWIILSKSTLHRKV